METTIHGDKRLRKRLGVGRETFDKLLNKAYYEGIDQNQAAGNLKRYIGALQRDNKTHIRIYNNYVWSFTPKNPTLITVYKLPTAYLRKSSQNQQVEVRE